MTERPIIFSGEMVREILDGRKTQTRRIINLKFDGVRLNPDAIAFTQSRQNLRLWYIHAKHGSPTDDLFAEILCPYGQPGDRLWVRETLRIIERHSRALPLEELNHLLMYRATHVPVQIADTDEKRQWVVDRIKSHIERAYDGLGVQDFYVPSIHMPRWASRIDLEVTAVRVERVQEIAFDDIIAEGLGSEEWNHGINEKGVESAVDHFAELWNTLHGPDAWDRNDWVWVIEFKTLDRIQRK